VDSRPGSAGYARGNRPGAAIVPRPRPGFHKWWLLATIVVASSFVEFRIRQYPDYAYTTYIPGVVGNSYGAPADYRVLIPFLNTWIASAFGWSTGSTWHLTRLAWFGLSFALFYRYLRIWVSPTGALGGVAGLAATLPLTYTNSWSHPDAIPELALYTLACLAVVEGRDRLFLAALVGAALNRETAGFLLASYWMATPNRDRRFQRSVFFAAVYATIFAGLRFTRGFEHYSYWQLARNWSFLGLLPPNYDPYKRAYAWFGLALLGPAVAVIASRWRTLPWQVRGLALSALPVVVTAVTISSIIETRIFTPLFPLIMPALMCTLLQPITTEEDKISGI
jgi:hypothetical protein